MLRNCFEEHLFEKEKETCHFAALNPRLGADYPVPTAVNQSVSSHKNRRAPLTAIVSESVLREKYIEKHKTEVLYVLISLSVSVCEVR